MKKLLLITCIITPLALEAGNYDTGKSYYIRKNYEKAKESFLAAVEANEKDGNSWYFLGEIYKNSNDFKEAERCYAQAVEGRIDKKFYNLAYWNLLVLVESRGNPMDTAKVCRQFYERTGSRDALKKIDTMTDKLLWTANTDAQKEYTEGRNLRKSSPTEAMKKLVKALSIDPEFLAPHYEIAMIYADRNDMPRAANELSIVANKLPIYYGANRLLADIYFNLNSFSEAVKYYTNCIEYGVIEKSAKNTILLRRGTAYYNLRDYDNAEKDISKSVEGDKNSDGMHLLSAIYISQEKYAEALEVLRKINAANPDNPPTLFQIGSLYYKQNDEQYSSYFDRLFAVTKGKPDADKYKKAFLINAKHHYAIKSFAAFLDIYAALPEAMKDFELKLMAGRAQYESGKFFEATRTLESLSLSNEDKLVLASAYLKDSRRDKCRELLLSLYKNSSDAVNRALQNRVLKSTMEEIIREEKIKAEKAKPAETLPQQNTVTQ